jgi:tRNA A-37 threonylcarbamoyl transferase component Bud32/tetratricopeptide (TPR) repeat protein
MNITAGMKVENYEILALLGSGGMGQVYRARDIQLGRIVAIKFLSEESENEDRVKRFFTEAKAASALNHPNILTVYGLGEFNGKPFIATEFVEGQTLRNIIEQGRLPLNRALDVTLQTLAGLSKAHSIGIVHRDLKPENIMISHDGFVKILDFGLAKLIKQDSMETTASLPVMDSSVTKTGMIIGTAAYMSPEQARGQTADLRSDLFSLGIVLYEMLTGINPFRRATAVDTISAILRDAPPSLVSTVKVNMPGLSELLEKTLEKEAAKRFSSAKEMEQAINTLRAQLNSKELHETVAYSTVVPSTATLEKPVSKPTGNLKWAAVAIVLVAIAGAAFLLSRRTTAPVKMSGPPVIAVMAFENKTADPELAKADIGRVLSDAFVQVLNDCKGVQVISPWRINAAAMEVGRTFSDTAHDLKLIEKLNQNLNANIILSGSLSQIQNTFILNATLTDFISGKLVGNFQSECEGKNEILSSLTNKISEPLKSRLIEAGASLAGGRDPKQISTGSLEAYTHYLHAKDLTTEGKWKDAVSELQNALAIDPNMAMAWGELACAYSFAGDDLRSKAAHVKALELKPRLNRREQAWLESIGVWITGNGTEYRKSMNQFMKDFPDERDAHFYVGLSWQYLDHDCKKALQSYELGFHLTPNYYPLTKSIIDCHLELNQKQQAIDSLNRYMKVVGSGYGYDQALARLNKIQSSQ